MELVSTRNSSKKVSFRNAVLDCVPADGGLYVPSREEDLRPWILYMDETTSFSSIAGTLTSALLKEEFSPVVSERIAGTAFSKYSPELRQLEDHLFSLELFHGPTGCHKDFGFLWFASALEHILTMEDRTAVVLAATAGTSGRSMANAFAGKKRLKMVLVYAKGTLTGLDPSILAWNGGNILPVEIDGDLDDAQSIVRGMYARKDLVRDVGLTIANTMNIGRLLPQVFFYMYAFTRLRKKVRGDIFYAVPSGNYGNLVAGLYAWKFSLPVNGFITDATDSLSCDRTGRCVCLDSGVPLSERSPADLARPSNIERLEQVFSVNPLMLRGLVFPSEVKSRSDSRSHGRRLEKIRRHARYCRGLGLWRDLRDSGPRKFRRGDGRSRLERPSRLRSRETPRGLRARSRYAGFHAHVEGSRPRRSDYSERSCSPRENIAQYLTAV